MKKQNKHTIVVQDERIEFVTNKYAAKALIFLTWYLFISVLIKSFTLDVNIFLYWDVTIALAVGFVYTIYRSAGEGVPIAPAATSILNPQMLRVFVIVSILFGLFITFNVSGMDERLSSLMPGFMEKFVATLIIGFLFFLLLTIMIWLIDILSTKVAFKKGSEMIDEPDSERTKPDKIITESTYRDERIDTTIEKYAADAFYFLSGYILFSSVLKLLIADIAMTVYADTFIAAMVAGGYFTFNMLKAGIYSEHKPSSKEKFSGWITFATSFLAAGMIMSFIVFPMDDQLAAKLDGITDKFFLGIILALLFGIGKILIEKVMDLYSRKRAEKLIEE